MTERTHQPSRDGVDSKNAATELLIRFFIELPEPIAIPDGSRLTLMRDDPTILTLPSEHAESLGNPDGYPLVILRFWREDAEPIVPISQGMIRILKKALTTPKELGDNVKLSGEELGVYRSIVEATTVLHLDGRDLSPYESYELCVSKLHEVVRSYQLATGAHVGHVTAQRLPFAVPFITLNPDGTVANGETVSLLPIHDTAPVPVAPQSMSSSALGRIGMYWDLLAMGMPMVACYEHRLLAERALSYEGDTMMAVIHAHTSSEVFLDGVLTFLLWEEAVSATDAATLFDDGLSKRIRRDYSGRIGGKWDSTQRGTIKDWNDALVRLRGRVVHSSYRPEYLEAERAVGVLKPLQDFVYSRLIAKKLTYPMTTLLLLGDDAIKRLGAWNGRFKQFAEANADKDSDWIESYVTWRRSVDAARR